METPQPHKRRVRYTGKNPRRFEDKYKEHNPQKYGTDVEKVIASGKTPAGTHRPIMVQEILEVLGPKPGEFGVDCTLGYGGHAEELLKRILPNGKLIGIDADPLELPKTELRLRSLGYGPENLITKRSNYAALAKIIAEENIPGVDFVLADLGLSSMQIDNPARGFTTKGNSPLDMRMNPGRGQNAADYLAKISEDKLTGVLIQNSDEPYAGLLAARIAGKVFKTAEELAAAIRETLGGKSDGMQEDSVRRVFQAIRIEVNDEFSALETLLKGLPSCLAPGGRVAILTFHSGEDRRVKRSFEGGLASGAYSAISSEVIRPSGAERYSNPRSTPAKLRWARK